MKLNFEIKPKEWVHLAAFVLLVYMLLIADLYCAIPNHQERRSQGVL